MGKQVTILPGFSGVLLPGANGPVGYKSGDTVTLTDAEYAALPASVTRALSTSSNVAEPDRPVADTTPTTKVTTNNNVSGAATAKLGTNRWTLTGNVTGVTFPSSSDTPPAPEPGNRSTVRIVLTQDATGSRTVTWGSKAKFPGGTAPTLSTAAGKVDIVVFDTYDGGSTYYCTDTILDVR